MNKSNFLHLAFKYLIIVVGSAVYATGFSFFLYPNSIVTGGVTGIAMIINYLTSRPVGVLTIIMNIPLFIIAVITVLLILPSSSERWVRYDRV